MVQKPTHSKWARSRRTQAAGTTAPRILHGDPSAFSCEISWNTPRSSGWTASRELCGARPLARHERARAPRGFFWAAPVVISLASLTAHSPAIVTPSPGASSPSASSPAARFHCQVVTEVRTAGELARGDRISRAPATALPTRHKTPGHAGGWLACVVGRRHGDRRWPAWLIYTRAAPA
jgi:hypothetical protein